MRKKLLALLLTLCMVLSLLPVTAMAVEGNVSQETGYGNAALPAAPAVKMCIRDRQEKVQKGEMVIVETARGVECGETAMENREVSDEAIVQPLRKVIRKATKEDLKRVAENRKKEKTAFSACEKKIVEHGLEMKLVDVEYTFDNGKILFYFTADGRVDFRELVKDLAGMFRTRIELRQIGVRDEAKMLGGIGICGRPFCCGSFLGGFQPVSIKMAKEQGLSLNPVKISGTCGRLMCCLKYEQEAYQDPVSYTHLDVYKRQAQE